MSNSEPTQTRATKCLPLDEFEFQEQTIEVSNEQDVVQKNAMQLIRQLMTEQKRQKNIKALPELADISAERPDQQVRHPRKSLSCPKAEEAVQALLISEKKRKPKKANFNLKSAKPNDQKRNYFGPLVEFLRGYRPMPKHVVFTVIALIAIMQPLLIPAVLFLTFWIVLIAYLTLGPDRVAELVAGAWYRLRAYRPDLAETIRHRADAVALRIDRFLDRLPSKWTDGLYLPDLSKSALSAQDEGEQVDPFQKLAAEARRT